MRSKTDIYYEIFDEIAMMLIEELGIDYLDAFHRTKDLIIDDQHEENISEIASKKIKYLLKALYKETFSQEDIRLALQLLTVKAFKSMNKTIELMTPDSINYILSRIINHKFANQTLRILDINLGTSNLLQTIANNFPNEKDLLGIEKDQNLVNLASSWAELENNDLKIYWQDVMMPIYDMADIEVGDLDDGLYQKPLPPTHPLFQSNISYYPYLAISSKLENLKDQGYFFYLINNDFFAADEVLTFRNYFQKHATMLALIVLPESMFQSKQKQKSILIGKKACLKSWELMIFPITSFSKTQIPNILTKLDQFTDNL
ncbi:MAG: hypothetical protein AB7V00_01855 [Bacilli bacterium]